MTASIREVSGDIISILSKFEKVNLGRVGNRFIRVASGINTPYGYFSISREVIEDMQGGMGFSRSLLSTLFATGASEIFVKPIVDQGVAAAGTGTPIGYGYAVLSVGAAVTVMNIVYDPCKEFAGTIFDKIAAGNAAIAAIDAFASKQLSGVINSNQKAVPTSIRLLGLDADIQANPNGATAVINQFMATLPQIGNISDVTVVFSSQSGNGDSSVTYTVLPGDSISKIAAAKGLTTQELLDRNSWLTDQGRVSADGNYVLIKPGEKLDLAGITFVTKYEYDSITAKYGDTAADGLDLNVVTTAAYNDWKRDAAIAAFNLFGQPAIQQLAPLSLLSPNVQSVINMLRRGMSNRNLSSALAA